MPDTQKDRLLDEEPGIFGQKTGFPQGISSTVA